MEKEELFNDGVNILKSVLRKYINDKNIPQEEVENYYIVPDNHVEMNEMESKALFEFIILHADSENKEKLYPTDRLFVSLKDICIEKTKAILTADSPKIDGHFSMSNIQYEEYQEEIEDIAKLYYMEKNLEKYEKDSEEFRQYFKDYEIEIQAYLALQTIVIDITEMMDIEEDGDLTEKAVTSDDAVEKSNVDEYELLVQRLDAGNSEKKRYDFAWDETALLNYANDTSLELAYRLIECGKISLAADEHQISISSYLYGFCDDNMTNEEFLEKYEENKANKERKDAYTWKRTMGRAFNTTTCHLCKYQSCPKHLAAYILYLKNQGTLKEKLLEREKYRKGSNIHNGFFLFDWKNENGLKKIDEKSFEFANELVNRDYIRLERLLNDRGSLKINEITPCKDLQLIGMDVSKLKASRSWDNSQYLTRKTNSEPDTLCDAYSCRLPTCPLEVAAYIYYLKMSGQEDKIKSDREYYSAHKEEIDIELEERAKKKIEAINSEKEEKMQKLKSSYDGKIENLNLTINSIMESDKTSFHCIVVGDEKDEKNGFIEKIVELLKSENEIQDVRRLSVSDFARLHFHYTNIRISKNEGLVYSDNEKEDPEKITVKRDSQGVPYHNEYQNYLDYKIYRRNKLETNAIYVLDGVQEFVNDFRNYSDGYYKTKKMLTNALDILTDMASNGYIIINAQKDEIEPFISLDARLKFVYQNNIINIPTFSLEDMYNSYLKMLNPDLLAMLMKDEEEYKKIFNEYVSLNQKFMPFTKLEIVNYIASYANTKNELTMPPNIYKKDNLDNIIGLETVKEKLKEFEKYMLFQIQAKASELNLGASNMHMIFTGNPGTGKTTVARIMAKMLFDLGVIKENKLIEVERKDLVGQYIGQTAPKTSEAIEKAMGGVLFVDEAYSLAEGRGDFGGEAIATLIKAMEDYKDNLVVIFAGYRNEMKTFTDMNPGIASRIGYTFDFPDYSVDELMQIFYMKLRKSGFEFEESVEVPLRRLCDYFSKRKNFGNGRFIDKVIQETLMKHAISDAEDIRLIREGDIPTIEGLNQNVYKNNKSETAEEMLSQIVGMEELKEEVLSFRNYIAFVREAEKQKIKLPDSNMHMIFTGNPGTGKTTIARIIAKMLFDMEIIHEDKLIEVERKDLVSGYVGQTAMKTSDVIEKAMGGVLFIDEAYTLAQDHGSEHGFGDEAIATLIKAMEDHKGEFVVIFAGYKKEMRNFIETNPGIASRVGYTFNFEDYSDKELAEIFKIKVATSGMQMEDGVLEKVKEIMKYFYRVKNIGNGRFVDKVLSKTLLNHSKRLANHNPEESVIVSANDIITIKIEDLPTVNDMTKTLLDGNNMIDPSKIQEKDMRKTAIHEVGHAAVGHLLLNSGFKKITCTAEGMGALGYVEPDDSNDSYTHTKEQLLNKIKMLLAGIGAEEVFLGVYQNGGSSDLEQATHLARRIITDFGMSDLGLAHVSSHNTEIEKLIYEEENKILGKCFEEVKQLISENRERMQRVADYLLEHGEINEEEFIAVFHEGEIH
ncbi:MAG: AAA family ATPase [Clostridia bacterium]|nr:AAA family ATPase [Clostridia bacterium]